jgi:hypothetical protein
MVIFFSACLKLLGVDVAFSSFLLFKQIECNVPKKVKFSRDWPFGNWQQSSVP